MPNGEKYGQQYNDEYGQRETLSKGEIYDTEAHPGRPMQPEQLEEEPPQFQAETQGARDERGTPAAHPTAELSSMPSHKAGKPSSGKHPTSELHIKPRGRR